MSHPHPSYAFVPKQAIVSAMNAPFGQAQAAIRKFVPDFVMMRGDHLIFDVVIIVSAQKTVRVAAPDKAAALAALEDYDIHDLEVDLDKDFPVLRVSKDQSTEPDINAETDD